MAVDRVKALVQFLKNNPSVSAMVGARIYDDEIPDAAVARMPKATVVIKRSGGARSIGGPDNDFSDARVDVRCYAWTKASAVDLELAVYDALRHLTRVVVGGTLLHWCRDASGLQTGYEPTTPITPSTPVDRKNAWPFAWRSWQVMAADIPVPV